MRAAEYDATGWWAWRRGTVVWIAMVMVLMSLDASGSPQANPWPGCSTALASVSVPVAPLSAPEDQSYDPLRGFDPTVDLGIGHLHAVDRFDWDWPTSLTLPLFARPSDPPRPVVWLVNGWVVPSNGPARALGFSGLTETGYEIASFIVFEARADGWVRLRFATGESGMAWTHACFFDQTSGRLAVERWETRLLSQEISPLYFRAMQRHALRSGPTEASERLRWIPAEPIYALRPLEIRGDWMRVELSQPSDYCTGPDGPPVDKVEGWIRWRDDSSGTWLWYYTRGC